MKQKRLQDFDGVHKIDIRILMAGNNEFYRVTVYQLTGFNTIDFDTMLQVIDFLYPVKPGQVG